MEVLLGNENYFVEGSKNAAIYKLKEKKVYALNETAKKVIIKYIRHEELNNEGRNFINSLIDKKIIIPDEIDANVKIEKPQLSINFAWLELTGNCNLRCIHCYGKFGNASKKESKLLDKEEWFDIIDQLYELGCKDIQLIGGEPFCNVNCLEIIKYLHKKKIKKITVFTNATLINDEVIKVLKECNVIIRFSLYGYNKETHEAITKVKGSFDWTIDAINKLRANNIKVSVAIVIMKENEKYLTNIRKFVENELKIRYNGFDVIRPSCINDNIEHRISDYKIISKRYYTYPSFGINKNQFIINHFYNPCLNSKIAITSEGDVIPCIFARDFVCGNVKEKKINDMINSINSTWEIHKNQIDECKDCEFKYACSDCRPLAIGINGNKFSQYPRCCYSPKEGVWKDIHKITKEITK